MKQIKKIKKKNIISNNNDLNDTGYKIVNNDNSTSIKASDDCKFIIIVDACFEGIIFILENRLTDNVMDVNGYTLTLSSINIKLVGCIISLSKSLIIIIINSISNLNMNECNISNILFCNGNGSCINVVISDNKEINIPSSDFENLFS